jgi:hypothetical protein
MANLLDGRHFTRKTDFMERLPRACVPVGDAGCEPEQIWTI